MKFIASVTLLALSAGRVQGFVPASLGARSAFTSRTASATSLAMSDAFSRIDGNRRDPTDKDIAVMDEMITKMAEAKPYELPNAVRRAFRVCSSPRFFIRIAERADMTSDDVEKDKLSALATNLAATVEAVVSTTEDQLDERAQDVEEIVKAAAEPDSGEFLVPLTQERMDAMLESMEKIEPSKLDESFLATVDSWVVKSHEDGMDGMVGILQKLLQLYAGLQVSRARNKSDSPTSTLLDKLLLADTDSWDVEIRQGLNKDVSTTGLVAEIQGTMETVILDLENGSMAQRIQAEYLKELVTRVEGIQGSRYE